MIPQPSPVYINPFYLPVITNNWTVPRHVGLQRNRERVVIVVAIYPGDIVIIVVVVVVD